MSSLRRSARLLSLTALAVALSACQGSGSDRRADPAATPAAGATTAAGDQVRSSPLDHYLGVGRSTDAGDDDEAAARRSEEAIAQCMARQGFEYVPNPRTFTVKPGPGGSEIVSLDDPTFPDLPPDQFAARFGYGISTAKPTADGADPQDQNTKLVRAMSVAERVAYYQALYGKDIELDSHGDLTTTITTDDGSCDGRAAALDPDSPEQQTQQQRIERVQASFKSLLDQVKALGDRELADPRVSAATGTWSGCMAAAGFPGYDDVSAPAEKIRKQALALMGPGFDQDGVDPTALANLRQEEVGLAVADNQCHQAWEETYESVRADLEATFVEENLTELKSYRSALAAATATTP